MYDEISYPFLNVPGAAVEVWKWIIISSNLYLDSPITSGDTGQIVDHVLYHTDTHQKPWGQLPFNTLRPRQNGRHFADDVFKCIFENENEWISPWISLKFVPKIRINKTPALVQILAWRRPGDKPLSEPMMVSLPTHLCVTRPQWVNSLVPGGFKWNFGKMILNLISVVDGWGIACEIALR